MNLPFIRQSAISDSSASLHREGEADARPLFSSEAGWRWPWRSRPSPGEGRRRVHRGGGIEFAEHRPYAQGEDLRHVDWGLYGRTGRLFTKVRESEAGHAVSLLFDGSSSMETGTGDKGRLARELAAALARTFVLAGETCRVVEFAEGLHRKGDWVRRRQEMSRLNAFVEAPETMRGTDWRRSLQALQALDGPDSPVVIISDFWGGEDMGESLRNLAASGCEMLGIQILSPAEEDPPVQNDVRWQDSETGETISLVVDSRLCREYRAALRKRREMLSAIFALRGGSFLTLTSDVSVSKALSHLAALAAGSR